VTLDDVTTPAGRREEQLGGSATYFALAAARFAPVHLCAVVGDDAAERAREALARRGIDLKGLAVAEGRTCRWRATHDFERWVTASESCDEGVYGSWDGRLTAAAAKAPVLFVGSMRPSLQRQVLEQSSAVLIGADSMRVYIEAQRAEVRALAEAADVLFLDRAEICALAEDDDWRSAARSLCGSGRLRAVVVKRGPEGAACVTSYVMEERPARPVERVVDPTGAGDALAGGFLGACARAHRAEPEFLPVALEAGLDQAALAISAFGVEALSARS
jgi:sugar/nucleoside kinase (ribokinase family)